MNFLEKLKNLNTISEITELCKQMRDKIQNEIMSADSYQEYILLRDDEEIFSRAARNRAREVAGNSYYKIILNDTTNTSYVIEAKDTNEAKDILQKDHPENWYGANIIETDSEGQNIPYGDFAMLPVKEYYENERNYCDSEEEYFDNISFSDEN